MAHLVRSISLALLCFAAIGQAAKNNVCKDFISYNFKDLSTNCYHDPDADTTDPLTIIRHHVPEVESYDITTEDGYILTMFRLPQKNPKGVLWLQHYVVTDGTGWITGGNNSFAFLAWNAGYDIWIPSQRGTTLSPGHVTLSTKDFNYWDFTFHEIGIFDYRSLAKFIYDKTNGQKSIFVGHSMSSTSSLIYSSTFPEEAKKYVQIFINMGTPVYFKHLPFYTKAVAPVEKIVRPLFNFLKIGGILRYDDWYIILGKQLIKYYPANRLATIALAIYSGWTPDNFDPQALALSIPKLTRGFSAKLLFHYAQLATVQERFQQFDYGKKKNLEIYGTKKPPTYDLQKITTPFHFVFTDSDYLATQKDNEAVYAALPKSVQYGKHVASKVNHIDYFLGKDRKQKIYDYLLDFIASLV